MQYPQDIYQTVMVGHHARMDVYEIRRERLRSLISDRFEGVQARLASAIDRQADYVSRCLRGTKRIGEEFARHVEQKLGLPDRWLDGSVTSDLKVTYNVGGNPVSDLEPGGGPRSVRPVPVVGTARLGTNGYYEELQYPVGHGDGTIESYSPDDRAYALRVKGDSMHPAIRSGAFIVAEPSRTCVPGEYVVLMLRSGQKMVKELVIERPDEIVVESVNGGERLTLERQDIERMHPVAAIVSASKWRPG